jgi:hypothetical protein
MTAEELLQTSPFEGDLDRELAARPARRKLPSATVYLGAGVLLVAGFAGGVQADKHWGSNGSSSGTGGFPGAAGGFGAGQRLGGTGQRQGGQLGALPGGQGAGGANAPGGAAGGGTFGTVKLVDGKTIYVQTSSGVVQVATNGSTKIRVSKDGKVKDLAPGSTVIVQGTAGKDGTMTATSINQAGGLSGGSPGGGRGGN